MAYNVGDVVTLDGIESVIIYDAGLEQEWGQYLCVDKNHDLVWYISEDDFYNTPANSPISNSAKYGYEWGEYKETGINDRSIGKGLSNTNSLINLNLQPNTSGWKVLWDQVKIFRETHSNKWFVPTIDELIKVSENKTKLINLSYGDGIISDYQTCCEYTENPYYYYITIDVANGEESRTHTKSQNYLRVRLCRYTTDLELNKLSKKKIQISTSTPEASIYYTINNSTPTTSSTLYTDIFQVEPGAIIKAIGVKEGYLNSDIAEFLVN